MDDKLTTRISTVCAALAIAAAAPAGITNPGTIPAQEKAKDVLRRVLLNGEKVPMDAIVLQRSLCDSEIVCQFRLEQDRQGRRKMVALGPLSIQGTVSFDDGNKWINVFPDENRMVIMPSPRADRDDIEQRIRLASQNYRFAMETGGRVAGRNAVIVVAIPRHAGLPTRKYAVDARNDVLLRVEALTGETRRDVVFDTRTIRFLEAAKVELERFDGGPMRIVKPEPPVRISRIADAKAAAGFTPLAPRSVPFGFSIRESVVNGAPGQRYVATRLSDGLVTVTMYQWKAHTQPLGSSADGLEFTHNGVTVRLSADLPTAFRARLTEALARDLGCAFQHNREPNGAPRPLNPKREHELARAIAEEDARIRSADSPET